MGAPLHEEERGIVLYETLMTVVRTFFGSGLYLTALKFAVPTVLVALIAWSSPAFRAWCGSWRDRGGWRAIFVALPTAGVKLLVVFILARLIIVAMVHQAQTFEYQHGNVTEANRSAVLMKWGYPHEQRELNVTFSAKRTWVTRQLLIPATDDKKKDTFTSDTYWKDAEPGIKPIDGVMPKVVSVQEEERSVPVEQKAIEQADVQIVLTPDARRLGGANYAGYRDSWDLRYVVVNRHDKPVTAQMHFPLPSRTGILKNLKVLVDGVSVANRATSSEDGIYWSAPMPAEGTSVVSISFDACGLDTLRYVPRRMTQTGHYRVTVTINDKDMDPRQLDWCIGSMSPDQKLDDIKTRPAKLTWTLDNALTSYDIGIKLPEAVQPNYYVARLLEEAPVGLILLLVLLVAPRLIVGRPVGLTTVGLMAAGYYLLYTFMGQLADIAPSFELSFLLSVCVLTGVVGILRLNDPSSLLMSLQDTIGFLALALFYPLAVVDVERTAFWMQVFYLAVLLYACVLVVYFRVLPALHRKEASSDE